MVDFFDFELGDSLVVVSVEDSLFGDFSVFASDFSVFLVVLFGLVAVSAAGLLAGAFVVGAGDLVPSTLAFGVVVVVAFGVEVAAGLEVAAGVIVAAGVVVAPTLAVAAGVALAFVEADVLVVVLGAVVVVVPEVVPVVDALTPNVVGTVTP